MKTKTLTTLLFLFFGYFSYAQVLTQTVRGLILDKDSKEPLIGATVIRVGAELSSGTTTDLDGKFILEDVPLGRHKFQISFVGYQPFATSEILVGSGKEVFLNIDLKESVTELKGVTVTAKIDKNETLNTMTLVSARTFSTEEAKRYAGGFDDPTRLVSAFAGVSAPQIESNGISVRGNAPSMVQYRMEGVEIENANHFEGGDLLGGGFVSIFNSHVLGNSDFLTGAFPAEYGNALSAVFDMNLRVGNNMNYEHSFEAGIMGIDVASEGPFKKGGNSSYLFNYRYSTFGLIEGLLPEGEGLPVYQDLSFKANFPTKYGVFSLWGAGAIDDFYLKAVEDSADWDMEIKREEIKSDFMPIMVGLNHRYALKNQAYIHTALLYAYYNRKERMQWLGDDLKLYDMSKMEYTTNNFTVSSFINKKFGSKHTNRTGLIYKIYNYAYDNFASDERLGPLYNVNNSEGTSSLIQAYSQSKFSLSDKLTFNLGLHYQMFILNNKYSLEPRLSLRYNINDKLAISGAYGLHSRMQTLDHYFVRLENGETPNKDLDFTKAQHFVLGIDYRINPNTRIKINPYYQILSSVPVIKDSSFAVINLQDSHNFNEAMVNDGSGTNIGVELTLERFLSRGFYYLVTASFYDSRYKGGDDIERNTVYNGNYVANILGGKEWEVGKKKINRFGVNGRLYIIGGNRTSPVDLEQSLMDETVVYDDTRLYEDQFPTTSRLDLSISFIRNRPKHTSTFSIQLLNALGSVITYSKEYSFVEKNIVEMKATSMLPNVSWKIEF
jgi:hypothetical protein